MLFHKVGGSSGHHIFKCGTVCNIAVVEERLGELLSIESDRFNVLVVLREILHVDFNLFAIAQVHSDVAEPWATD